MSTDEIEAWRNIKKKDDQRMLPSGDGAAGSKEIRGWRNALTLTQKPRSIGGGTEIQGWKNSLALTKGAKDLGGGAPIKTGKTKSEDWGMEQFFSEIEGETVFVDDNVGTGNNDVSPSDLQQKIFGVYFDTFLHKHEKKKQEEKKHTNRISSLLNFFNGTMPNWERNFEDNGITGRLVMWFSWVLRGVGQVFFCNNPLTGLVILGALFTQGTRVPLHCILSIVTATFSAEALGFETSLTASGLFGYNAALVGIALSTFYSSNIHSGYETVVVIATVIVSIFCVLLFVALSKILLVHDVPPMTLPFDISVNTALLASVSMARISFEPILPPSLPDYDFVASRDYDSFFRIVLKGIGQIVFVNDWKAPIMILIGLAFCSRIIAVSAFLGSVLATGFAILVGLDAFEVNDGLYSYCPTLTFIATMVFYVPSLGSFLLATMGVVFTTILQATLVHSFGSYGLPVNSFPFSFIMITLVLLQGDTKRLFAVPLTSITTPEDHFHRVQVLRDGFKLLLDALSVDESSSVTVKRKVQEKALMAPKNSLRSIYSSFASTNESEIEDGDYVGHYALEAFKHMNKGKKKDSITISQFEDYLDSIGFREGKGKAYACNALSLIDLDKSDSIELPEWIAFCRVSVNLLPVSDLVSNFLDFVDTDKSGSVDTSEINDALDDLNEVELTTDEVQFLARFMKDGKEIETSQLHMFVCVNTLKKSVQKYHDSKN